MNTVNTICIHLKVNGALLVYSEITINDPWCNNNYCNNDTYFIKLSLLIRGKLGLADILGPNIACCVVSQCIHKQASG